MADDVKSLLEKYKSPGSTFGELAGAYLSGGRKKSNRARNLLVASLFFNAKENQMRSKVARQLQDLEDEKSIEKARLAAEFKKRSELQTIKEAIDDQGAFNYYQDEASAAFDRKHAGNLKPFELAGSGQDYKNKWMEEWANSKRDMVLKNYDANVDPDMLTIEEFSKNTNDYFKAKTRDILKPENISLVHKMFNKLPGFGSSPQMVDGKLKTEGDIVKEYDNKRKAQNARVGKYIVTSDATVMKEAIGKETIASFEIDQAGLNTLLSESTLNGTDADSARIRRSVQEDWIKSGKTYSGALRAILSHETAFDFEYNEARMASAKSAYEAIEGPKPVKGKDENDFIFQNRLDNWERGLKAQQRQALGIINISEDAIYKANELFDLAVSNNIVAGTEEEKAKFIQDVIQTDLMKATGRPDPARLRETIIQARQLELLQDIGNDDIDVMTAIKNVNIKDNASFMADLGKKAPKIFNKLNEGATVQEINQLTTVKEFTDEISRFRKIQKEYFLVQQAQESIIVANAVVDALKNPDDFGL